jgi:FkbM family methyltransferase
VKLGWRSLAERLSRGVVLRRRLPVDLGGTALFVSPDASLRFWRRSLEAVDPGLLALCRELVTTGRSVWDVGANVGVFAFGAAHLTGPSGAVLAVEPDPGLAALLRRSAASAAGGSAVKVVNAAICDRPGTAELVIARRGRATNHLAGVPGSSQTGGRRGSVRIAATTLDALLADHRAPDLVKIDVEGAEHLCLAAAARVLREVRPLLLCEVSAQNHAAVGGLLREHGYVMLDSSLPPPLRQPRLVPAWNTLAVPRERWRR